jgi:uncharacterized membrane protein
MATTQVKAKQQYVCQICGKTCRPADVLPGDVLHGGLHDRISAEHPNWVTGGFICLQDLNRYRREYIEGNLAAEQQEVTVLQREVLDSIKENELLSKNINDEFQGQLSFGDRLADQVAAFGGSWKFIIIFGVILFVWIFINSLVFFIQKPFDPYPYILLNLVLSCVAAMQAPVIMMSQNRQEAKDRLRSEQDFRTNLKAELEIRNLNAKIDELITHQWQRLLEIQQIQLDMMEENSSHHEWERSRQEGWADTTTQ